MIDHPYQLRRIELRDFKSVAHASVGLQPLTVVVGANSSGKSTLLQSILAVTQAVRSGAGSAEFPLNGEFVRLGTFHETRNFRAEGNAPMEVAFELMDPTGMRRYGFSYEGEEADQVAGALQLSWRAFIDAVDAQGEESGGFARISSLKVEINSVPEGAESVDAIRLLACDVDSLASSDDSLHDLDLAGRGTRLLRTQASRALKATGRVQDWTTGESQRIDAVVLAGGVPRSLLHQTSPFDLLARMWWDIAQELLIEPQQQPPLEVDRANPSDDAVTQAVDDLRALMPASGGERGAPPQPTRGVERSSEFPDRLLFSRLGKLAQEPRDAVARSILELGEVTFRDRLKDELADDTWFFDDVLVDQGGSAGNALRMAGAASQQFFRNSVRYLGPLREAPHVLYDPGPSKRDLGVRGEYTAAVLHSQARTRVLMPTTEGRGVLRPLGEALNYWLQTFGLAEKAESEDRGRIGIGLSITPQGLNRPVDLTSVGVGVSQVLPVILLCLLAEPGALLVLEQPELHLHPRLQQDLADFLLACARSGRQLVIETHSEHLVNRLRRRIAADESDETRDLVGLVFAENDDGVTSYRPSEVNSYGGLGEDWPAGFLDLGAKESQELVKESLSKRKREAASAEER